MTLPEVEFSPTKNKKKKKRKQTVFSHNKSLSFLFC
jgi:hypothetical protein